MTEPVRVVSGFRFAGSRSLRRSVNIYPIQFYESEFGALLEQPEHAHARAIRIHERRKSEPGYSNRGTRTAFRRWFNAALEAIYNGGGIV